MRARAWPLPLALVSLAFAASLLLAGALPLIDPDEGRNAEVAREMSVGGDLVIPHLAGMPYLDKPPAFFWATALAIRLLGRGLSAHRLEDLGMTRDQLDDFTQIQKPVDSMSFLELRAYVQKLQESGHQVGKYIVGLYAKLSFPLIHVIMAVVAIPFALLAPRSGGRAMGIAVAIMISVGYWVVNAMAISFAKADLLPPLLAAWTANIVFAGLGVGLFLRART